MTENVLFLMRFLPNRYGLDYAINASGCDVINMSWGGGGFSTTYQILFNLAKAKGIMCVAAAGNSNSATPMYPASYNHVISVAASSSMDTRASFSNYGANIDVTAPGVNILSTLAGATNSYGNLSGTSMASPLVAGLCALMKCYNPMPVDSIEACLKRTCDNIDAQNPSYIGQLGAGRVNAFQALQCLTRKPKSDFIALDTFQCIGKSVRYVAKSYGVATLTYSWSFPGGTPATSTLKNPIVTYSSNGYKSATLITCNGLGCDTIIKTNIVNIDTPKAWLIGRKYTSYNSNPVIVTVNFKGNPPYSVTLTDGTNNFSQTNIRSNPYFFSITPKSGTSYVSIQNYSDSSCLGNKYGVDTVNNVILSKDTTYCVTLKTSDQGAMDLTIGHYDASTTNYTWQNYPPDELTTERWTCGGSSCNLDAVIKFNLAAIPANAIINSAYLSLYTNNAVANWSGQPTAGSNNSATLSRITTTWNTIPYPTIYPTISATNQISLPQTPTSNSNHTNIDIKSLIQDIVSSGNNYGMLLRLNTNNYYNSLQMCSRQTIDTSKHPKLVLCYTIPGGVANTCRDSLEINSAQSGWQALQTNGTWGSLSACNYVTSIFTANAASFPGMTSGDCLWGPIVSTPLRTYYNSPSNTTTSNKNANITIFRKSIPLPYGSTIDSVRLWMLSDDFVDSVLINSKSVYTTPIPIIYGQVLFTKQESNVGIATNNNYITIKAGDLGGNYGHYFRMKVYYSQSCVKSSCKDSIIYYTDTSNWYYQNTSGTWVKATLGINSCNQSTHPWSPINQIGIQNANQMIWGNTSSTTCNVKRDIVIPDISKIDSIRVLVQADDNIVAFKVNGTLVTSTPFGWNNVSSVLVNKSLLINGTNTFNIEGTNANGACAWVAMKMIFYKDTCKTTSQDCDTSGLILCMSMDGNANDSTKYNNHGIIRGATPTTGRNGASNGAYYFNGTTSYITLGVKPMLKPNAASISVWVKPHTFNTYIGGNANCIILTKNPNNPGSYMEAYSLYLTNRSGPTKFMTISTHQPTTNEKWFQSVQNTSLNQWTHLVLTFDYDSLKLYVNGQLDNKTYKGFNNVYDALDSIMIGYSANTMNKNYFKGDMDELKMYNHVLSPSEVLNLYTKPFTCSCATLQPPQSDCDTTNLNTGLIAYYPLDGNAQDLSGNNNHGTAMGGLTYISGKKGQAANYDGINDYINLNKKLLQGLSDFSVTGWVYLNQNLAYPKGFNIYRENNNGWNGAGLDLLIGNYNLSKYTMAASWSNGSGTGMQSYAIWENTIDSGKWYCFTLTRSSDTMKLYLNGQLTQSKYHPFTNTPTNDGILGGWWFNNDPNQTAYSKGYLDDVRFYNRALAPSEVKGYCGTCTVQPPIDSPKCTKPQKYTLTKCTNADAQLSARVGSQYQWSPKNGLSSDTVRSPWTNIMMSQTYLVSYLDTAKCQIVDTFVVTVKPTAPYLPISDQLICSGDSVMVNIPISATNILWSPNIGISNVSSSSPYLFPTTNQTYYLRFTDTAGCVQYDTIVVNVKICCPARARFALSDTMLCFGNNLLITNQSKGSINFYDWKFGNAIPSSYNAANPPAIQFPYGGSYPIRLIVGNGVCKDTMSRMVYVVEVKPWAGNDTTNCLAAFSIQLGDYPISDWIYNWMPATYLNDNTIANPTCNIVNDSVRYILEVTDKYSGCKGYDTVVVKTGRNIPSNTVNKRICFGDSVLFYGSYKKAKGQYFNTIKKVNSTCDSFIDVLNLDVLTPVRIQNSDERYCNYYIDKKGKRYDVSFTYRDTIRSKTLNCDSLINNTNIFIYKVKYDTVDLKNCKEVLFKGKRYTTSKKNIDSTKIVSAYSGCDSIVTRYNAIVYPIPNAVIIASKPNPIVYADTVTLTAKGGGSYYWLHNSSIDSTIIHRSEDTMYKIYIVRVTDSNNCWDTASYLVKGILPDTLFYGIPRAFSPNGDNMNDVFIPNMNYGISINEFFVWNRWGEKMWETYENKGWDGYYKGKLAPPGVYVYYVMFNTPWGKREYKGSFVLMR